MKNKLSKKLALIASSAILLFSACEESPYPGYELTDGGLYHQFYEQNEDGKKPSIGDVVEVIMSYKNDKDSLLFSSDDPRVNKNGDAIIKFPLLKPAFEASLENGLMLMSEGDSASFLISADSTFADQELPPFIEKGSLLSFYVRLKKVMSKEEVEKEETQKREEYNVTMELRKNEEAKILANYIVKNKITATPTESGLYVIQTIKGKGKSPAKGNNVSVNYTGRLIDGTIFDTSDEGIAKEAGLYDQRRPYEPIKFPLGQGQVIPGWDEGIALLKKGGKAQFIIPSSIGYGERGGGPIPPYSTLIFEVELVDFE
jgi:FKBP-type peptidyl-prolyl cis-trans isomerase